MVDSTPFQPIFSPGDFRSFPPAVATEGPALSFRGSASAPGGACDHVPAEAHPA